MNDLQRLFFDLYGASSENEVDKVMGRHPEIFREKRNWRPYGQLEGYFAVIENQQSSAVPALVEKITNSIDAILMRRCLEQGINPRSSDAPNSIQEAVKCFFPDASNWDLSPGRKKQAEDIQIIADGPKLEPSLVIYDNGEGQHPEDFEETLLSLLKGNKSDIFFVQGKYNMGGTGAIAFCGKKRYQLVASKRFDGKGQFGFTLIRRHPLTDAERPGRRTIGYEYLVVDNKIPAFKCDELDLGLYKRKFTTGTVIKLYSYDLPAGSRSVISRDLNQSINEYLFEPALPVYTIDTEERYPDDRNLQRELYGLKRRLEEENSRYVEKQFSESYSDQNVGAIKVTGYVFKAQVEGKDAKTSRESIRREFFKNNMSVLFSLNGQVHGHYTAEFVTRSLKMPLFKDHLLIHVDCTEMKLEYRNELFMASRDRLKDGDETRKLRDILSRLLRNSELEEIYKRRKAALSVETSNSSALLRNFSKNLPLNPELTRLLNQTFKLDIKSGEPEAKESQDKKPGRTRERHEQPFVSKRFPSQFRIEVKNMGDDGLPMVQIPAGSERTIRFNTDVEDQYFDRVSEPGEIKIALLGHATNTSEGGKKPGEPKNIESFINVAKASPDHGTIRVAINPTEELGVGDAVKIKAILSAPGQDFEQVFWVKVVEPEPKKNKKEPDSTPDPTQLGLPGYVLVYKEPRDDTTKSWTDLGNAGIQMDWKVVVHLFEDNDTLQTVYINMDSTTLLNYKSRLSTQEQLEVADRRYITAVYFHTLFLYMITKGRQYTLSQHEGGEDQERPVEIADYIKDMFANSYAEFLLNFGMGDLMASLEE